MTRDAIDAILRRPARHWTIDGIAELLVGSLLLLWGMAVSAQQLWPSRVTMLLASVVPVVTCVALAVFHRRIATRIQRLKIRWTYPRVGYVKVPAASRARKAAAAILGAVVGAGGAALLARRGADWSTLMPLLMGVAYAVGAALFWVLLGIRRLLVYALLALASGALAQCAFPARLGVGFVMCVAGLSWGVGGAIVLRGLLRLAPMQDQA